MYMGSLPDHTVITNGGVGAYTKTGTYSNDIALVDKGTSPRTTHNHQICLHRCTKHLTCLPACTTVTPGIA